MEQNKCIVYSYSGGRCVGQRCFDSIEQAQAFISSCRVKGQEVEVFELAPPPVPEKKEAVKQPVNSQHVRHGWERPVQCVETRKVFRSISECSEKLGIGHKSIWNALNSHNPRQGLHFVPYEGKLPPLKKKRSRRKASSFQGKKVLCITTGQVLDSVKETLRSFQNISRHTFYKAVHEDIPVFGLKFRYL